MHPHTKFGIPTSKNIGDMDRTRKRDGRTDGRTDSAITICLPKFLWGHKNNSLYTTTVKSPRALTPLFGNGDGALGVGKISGVSTKIGKIHIVYMFEVSIARLIQIVNITLFLEIIYKISVN